MSKYISYIFVIIFFSACRQQNDGMKIIFTGDVILDRGVADQLNLHGNELLINSFDFIQDYDYLFINLESTITETGNVQKDKYNFKAPAERLKILKKIGVTHVQLPIIIFGITDK